MKDRNLFENKILPLLQYIGAIGAGLMCVVYIIVVLVLIQGFEQIAFLQTTVFSIVNAIVGLLIMQLLKIQGQSFAENLEENKSIINEYHNTKTKDKKPHSMTWFWVTSVLKDFIIKCGSLAITMSGVIYIVIEGSNDWSLLSLAIANLILFICFGLLQLDKTYKFYNNSYIPYIKQKIEEAKIEKLGEDK